MSFLGTLAAGYTADQVLDFLSHGFPVLTKKLKKAKSLGYDIKEIFKMLEGSDKKKLKELEEKASRAPDREDNPYRRATRKSLENSAQTHLQNAGKAIGTAALGAAGLYGLNKFGPQLRQGINGALGGLAGGKNPIPPTGGSPHPIGPQPMANAPVAAPQVPTAPVQQANPAIAAGAIQNPEQQNLINKFNNLPNQENISPEMQKTDQNIPISKIEQSFPHLDKKAKSLLETATPEQAYEALNKSPLFSPLVKKYEELGRPFLERIKELDQTTNLLPKSTDSVEEPKKPEKGGLVFDESSGITGTLKDIKSKEGLLDEDGKIHKVKTDSLLHSELPEKDLADLYTDLISGIEKETKQDVSRNVEFAGYDPEHNELAYKPHTGGTYVYDDIPEEDVKLLTSLLTKRKTSGENFIGAWQEGTESPIGAAMSALIQRLQKERGGKGKEYSRKFQTIYSAHEPAQLAAKKKKAEEARKRKQK